MTDLRPLNNAVYKVYSGNIARRLLRYREVVTTERDGDSNGLLGIPQLFLTG